MHSIVILTNLDIYKEQCAYKDYLESFVEDHDRLNLFENVHQEIDEDLLLNLL